MTISTAAVIDWCTQLLESTPDFPPMETCLQTIPGLAALADLPAGTRVLVRGDVDVVVDENGRVTDDIRLRSLLPTLKIGCDRGWVQILYGHRGRDPEMSLQPVARHIETLLGGDCPDRPAVEFIADWLNDETGEILSTAAERIADLSPGTVVVLENTRKYSMERLLWKATPIDLPAMAERLARYANGMRDKLAAVHVNEGFAASNRDLSSTLVPLAMDHIALGTYIETELRQYVTRTRQAELVIFSGIKINKLDDLEQILDRGRVRMVIAAGSLAIALEKANNPAFEMGLAADESQRIFISPERIQQAGRILDTGRSNGVEFVLPIDFILGDGTESKTIPPDGAQFDIGPLTSQLQAEKVGEFIEYSRGRVASGEEPAVAFHNGVFGKFEEDRFSQGTRRFIEQLKRMHDEGVEVYVGGGEGGAALHRYGDESWVTHCFTAGGTILKALGQQPIPYLKALYLKSRKSA